MATNEELKEKSRKRAALRLFNNQNISYKYYDKPDGQDLSTKMLCTSKWAFFLGSALGVISIHVHQPRLNTFTERFLRYSTYVFPALVATNTFTITVYYSTVKREKDDEINYFCGGAAAGAILGILKSSVRIGASYSMIFGVVAAGFKYILMKGQEPFPEITRSSISPYFQNKFGYTFVNPSIKGNWTRDPNSQN